MKTTVTVTELDPALVPALRLSETLPCDIEHGTGSMRVLQDKDLRSIGYIVEKTNPGDAWESLEPRFFLTTSFNEAVNLLKAEYGQLPAP